MSSEAQYLLNDAAAEDCLVSAHKAMEQGKFEKAMAYSQMSVAHQIRADSLRANLNHDAGLWRPAA